MFQPPMDPPLDPPPFAAQLTAVFPHPANPIPVPNHPPYPEMITSAITELNEPDGSSKRAIAKHIEAHFPNLPPAHSELLTQHIQQLKGQGQLVMVKNSYKLPVPGSVPFVASNGAVDAVTADPASAGTKKRRGRPPKAKTTEILQAAVPVFGPPMDMNADPIVVPQAAPLQPLPNVAIGPVDGSAVPAATPRGRGRPPKQGGVKRGPGRPTKAGGGTPGTGVAPASGRGRGRPKKAVTLAAAPDAGPAAGPVKRSGKPRGRPRKTMSLAAAPVAGTSAAPVVDGGFAPVSGKRRGRPPKAFGDAKKPKLQSAVQPRKPRVLSGRPVGRPKKTASPTVAAPNQDAQMALAYLDLKNKHDNLQSRIMRAAHVIRPCLTDEGALGALEDLEQLASEYVNPPPNVQIQQQPQPQPQPQPQQQPQPQPQPQYQPQPEPEPQPQPQQTEPQQPW